MNMNKHNKNCKRTIESFHESFHEHDKHKCELMKADDSYHKRVICLYNKLKDAIVNISCYYVQEGQDTLIFTGSGFFIENKNKLYIVTAAHIVLINTVINPMTSIFVGVNNVNGKGKRFIYRAKIVGVDATADV